MAVFTSIGAALFGAGTFLAGLTAAGLQIAAGVAVSMIAKSLAGEPQPPKFGVQGKLQGGDDVPRSINFGWNCTAGSLVYHNTWGSGGVYSTRVIALGDMPIRELRQVIVDGVPVTLDGTPHADYGYPALEYRKGLTDHLWIKFYDGTQTTADSFLTGTVASAERPYGATRVGKGIPYVIVTARAPARNDEEKPLFQGVPELKFVTYGAKLFNPADATHVWADPSTWGGDGDFNPVVQIYNLLRGLRFDGQWVYGLQDLSEARLPSANWLAAINKAQAMIDGPDGLEATYRAGGEVQVGAQIKVAIEALLTSCQGRLAEIGGTYKITVGEPDAAVMAFSDDDIISTEEQSFVPFLGLADTINGVAATYPNPSEGWNTKTAPPLLRPDLEALDGNRRLMASVSLDMVPYPGQVQRLMKSALLEALRARRHTLTLGPEYWVLEPGDIVTFTSERNGYVEKQFRVDGVVYKANLDVIVDLTEVDGSDYDWNQAADYVAPIDGPLAIVGPAPMPMTGWQVFPATIRDQDGVGRRPSIEVRYDSGLSDVARVRVQVRVAGETDPMFDGEVPYADPWKVVLAGQFSALTQYEVRGIFIRDSGGPGEWSSWLAVTTPDVKLGAKDISIELDEIAAEIAEDLKWISRGVRDAVENFERLGSLLAEQDIANYHDRQTLKREIEVRAGALEASFTEIIEVALGPGGAIATALSSLYAAMGGNTAEVLVRWGAESTPVGVTARWGLQLSTNGDDFGTAAILAQVRDGDSEIVLDADRTVISSDGGATVAALFEAGTTTIATARIGDASIEAAKIADLAVTSGKIDDLAVTEAKIASAAITSAKIDDAAITAAKIDDLQVTTIKIADAAVNEIDSAFEENVAIDSAIHSISVTVDVDEYPMTIGAVVRISKSNPSDLHSVRAWLYVNGVEIAAEAREGFTGTNPATLAKLSAVNLPGLPGAYTCELKYQSTSGGTLHYASLAVAVPKK